MASLGMLPVAGSPDALGISALSGATGGRREPTRHSLFAAQGSLCTWAHGSTSQLWELLPHFAGEHVEAQAVSDFPKVFLAGQL